MGKEAENRENIFFIALAKKFRLRSTKLLSRVKEQKNCLWTAFYQMDFMKR